jgi:hypothetical protein
MATTTKATANKAARAAAGSDEPKLLDGIFVRSLAPRFRRAGFEFTREGYRLLLADLSEEQLKAIEVEPLLSVERIEIPATAADDALLAEQVELATDNQPAE